MGIKEVFIVFNDFTHLWSKFNNDEEYLKEGLIICKTN